MPPKNREIRKRLRQEGWDVACQRGSHEIWKHPTKPGSTVMAGRDNEEPPPGTLKAILREMGIDEI